MKKVFISAGHSNTDPGAVGKLNGQTYTEARIAMNLRDGIAVMLGRAGVPFATDGPPGTNHPLRDAVTAARACDGVRVEFHLNASANQSATGIEVLARSEHKVLAQSLAACVQRATGLPLRGDKGWKPENSGQHHRLAFISNAGGMICEVGFISNPEELQALVERFDALVKELAAWFEEQAKAETKAEYAARVKKATASLTPKVNVQTAGGDGPEVTPPDNPTPILPTGPPPKSAAGGPATVMGPRRILAAPSDTSIPEHARGKEWTPEQYHALQRIKGNQDAGVFGPSQPARIGWRRWVGGSGLGAVGVALYQFGQWLLAHRLEIAVWMTLAGVVVLIGMTARKEGEAR